MINLEAVGKKIMEQREKIHLTQNELAEKLFVTRQAVSKWEMGKSLPSMETMIDMTRLFHVSIDYMLEQTDLNEHDYKTMFMQYPRESVIYRFLNSNDKNNDIKHIFYLLAPKERKSMIDQLISGQLEIDIHALWPYLNMAERKELLANLLSKQQQVHVEKLYHLLSDEERMMVSKQIDDLGITTYKTKINKKGEK